MDKFIGQVLSAIADEPKAIDEMKAESELPLSVELRQNKYLNNRIKQHHCFIKGLTFPRIGFYSFNTADANIKRIFGDEHAVVLDKSWESKKEMLKIGQNTRVQIFGVVA